MANILLLSDNQLFKTDLHEQLSLYASEFSIFDSWNEEIVFDAAIIDDQASQIPLIQNKIRQAPILFLGNDDLDFNDSVIVITKPLKLSFLLDSILSCVNRFIRSHESVLSFGKYSLDSGKKELINRKTSATIKLTEREVMILNYLYKAHPKIVSKSELLSQVWEYNPDATTHTVETHIYRLRQKIEGPDSHPLITTEDSGYLLNF